MSSNIEPLQFIKQANGYYFIECYIKYLNRANNEIVNEQQSKRPQKWVGMGVGMGCFWGGSAGGLGKSDCCELETKVNCNKSFVIDKRTTNKTPLQLSAVVVVCRTEARPTGWDVVSGWLEWVVVRGG